MKKISLGLIMLIFLLACSSNNSTNDKDVISLPKLKPIAEGNYGILLKYQDGNNTIYVYERGGVASISVISNCNQ